MAYNNKNLFLTVQEPGKYASKANSALSWVADDHLSTVSSHRQEENGVETGPRDQCHCIQQQDRIITGDEHDNERKHFSKIYSEPDTDLSKSLTCYFLVIPQQLSEENTIFIFQLRTLRQLTTEIWLVVLISYHQEESGDQNSSVLMDPSISILILQDSMDLMLGFEVCRL